MTEIPNNDPEFIDRPLPKQEIGEPSELGAWRTMQPHEAIPAEAVRTVCVNGVKTPIVPVRQFGNKKGPPKPKRP
ncbi:MAG: hypothetical protein HY429_03445 [Candidatus Levybacteria bacterium]|nr:hypothetical protein [Candidatus Levybacteria bacterium]